MNRKVIILLICFAAIILPSYAEIVVLKNGKIIEGKIIERTNRYVKINILDIPLTYYFDDIESIDGQKIIKLPADEPEVKKEILAPKKEEIPSFPVTPKKKLSLGELKEAQDSLVKATNLFKEKKQKEAMIEFENAIKINPNLAEGYYGLGYVYASNTKYPEAIACFNKAIELAPNYLDAYNGLAYVFSAAGDYVQSIDYYRKALKIKPDNLQALNGLGYDYASLGKYKEAIDYFKQAIKIDLGYAPAYSGLGVIYYTLGQHIDAKENFLKAREILVKNKEEESVKAIDEYLKKLP